MSESAAHENGPGWRVLAGIGLALLVLAGLIWVDAGRLPQQVTVGVGPAAGMRLVAMLVAVLGLAHGVSALRVCWRRREGAAPRPPAGPRTSVSALAWVLGGMAGLVLVLELGGGFVIGAAWLFVATARAFGQRVGVRSVGVALVLTAFVFLVFTKALSLSLPVGPLERLLMG